MIGRIVTKGLRLRKGPGVSYDYIDELTAGDVVRFLHAHRIKEVQPWEEVQVTHTLSGENIGERGYIYTKNPDYLKLEAEAPLLPREPQPRAMGGCPPLLPIALSFAVAGIGGVILYWMF